MVSEQECENDAPKEYQQIHAAYEENTKNMVGYLWVLQDIEELSGR